MTEHDHDICVVGGAGHVGLPLALAFAAARQRVLIYDLNTKVMEQIRGGAMPFVEYGAEPLLEQALRDDRLTFSSRVSDIGRLTNRMWCYFAADATIVTDRVDVEEGITRLSVTEQEALAMAADGRMEHALNLAALFLAVSKRRLLPG